MIHEPECRFHEHDVRPDLTACMECDKLRAAALRGYRKGRSDGKDTVHDCAQHSAACCSASYTAGYNDHARTVQHWQDTHGAYRMATNTAGQYAEAFNQHGERERTLLPALTAVRLANCGFPDDLSQHTQCECREAALGAIFAEIDGGTA